MAGRPLRRARRARRNPEHPDDLRNKVDEALSSFVHAASGEMSELESVLIRKVIQDWAAFEDAWTTARFT